MRLSSRVTGIRPCKSTVLWKLAPILTCLKDDGSYHGRNSPIVGLYWRRFCLARFIWTKARGEYRT
jgi:hypothetical protein